MRLNSGSLVALAAMVAVSAHADQCPRASLGYVDAHDHALLGMGWNQPSVDLPDGVSSAPVDVSGEAWSSPGIAFGGVVLYFRTREYEATYQAATIGSTTSISELVIPTVYASFADLDPSDNSGSLTVTVTPTGRPPMSFVVDALAHCFDMSGAEFLELPNIMTCSIEATGVAWYGGARYRSAILGYLSDTVPPKMMFGDVFANTGPRPLSGVGTPVVYVFFQDCCIGDNSGGFSVDVRLDDFVPVREATWGKIKASWYR
jgi:hypothetical protein